MAKPATLRDGVTVVIPVHNAVAQLEKMLPAWGMLLNNPNRPVQLIVVNDGSTDGSATALEKLGSRVPHLRVLTHDTHRGFGACLRTALAETTQPLFLYAGIDGQYTPRDIHQMLERIELRDEVFGKQPDLISGARAGLPRPALVRGVSAAWKLFWRVFAGLPIVESPPWYGWGEWWYRARAGWVFGVPLADVNSQFKLYRTAFLKRFPIQSDGDFVHVELVAKATFLTSIMDEIPLTPKADPHPPLGPVSADRSKVFSAPEFAVRVPVPGVKPPEAGHAPAPAPTPPATEPNAGASAPPSAPAPTEPAQAPKTDVPPASGKSDPKPEQVLAQHTAGPTSGTTAAPSTASEPIESTRPSATAIATKSASTSQTDPQPAPSKSESTPEQTTPPTPSVAAQENTPIAPKPASAPATDTAAPVEPSNAPQPEVAKPVAAEAPKPAVPAPTPPAAEPNAGGHASPGSPVPAS